MASIRVKRTFFITALVWGLNVKINDKKVGKVRFLGSKVFDVHPGKQTVQVSMPFSRWRSNEAHVEVKNGEVVTISVRSNLFLLNLLIGLISPSKVFKLVKT
ncbi:TPA: hypothetical protein O4G41_004749 [Vibrio alginolyticus]|uniref:hypothetical protein n=1 Tax=Vibrio TaxID=662 RepID=UPI001F167D90|nr:hypothetical protein [Vibrio sp. D54]MCF7510884.1 hypothetical protein [Vibrio sp. D54]HCZ9047747.1 hypothetical protein [Vibrio alginolyticus]HCZ9302935.1 hypothetical protein [Vibrio alginolyticus]